MDSTFPMALYSGDGELEKPFNDMVIRVIGTTLLTYFFVWEQYLPW
ncbi:hypothetical protein [Metabacillus herbersteinensis]